MSLGVLGSLTLGKLCLIMLLDGDGSSGRVLGSVDRYNLDGVDMLFMGSDDVGTCINDAIDQLQREADKQTKLDAYDIYSKIS